MTISSHVVYHGCMSSLSVGCRFLFSKEDKSVFSSNSSSHNNVLCFSHFVLGICAKVYRSKEIVKSNSPIAPVRAILRLYRHPRGSGKITRAGRPTVRRTRFVLPVFGCDVYAKTRLVGGCTNRCRICSS